MARFAILKNRVVENVVIYDTDMPQYSADDGSTLVSLPDDSPVAPGWTFANNDFVPPAQTTPTAAPAVDPVAKLQAFLAANPDVAKLVGASSA